MGNGPIRVAELGLMPKTAVILQKNGIVTLDDLLLLDDKSIRSLKGLSYHRAMKVQECKAKWQMTIEDDTSFEEEKQIMAPSEVSSGRKSICSYLKNRRGGDRNLEVFANYYGSFGSTLEEIASMFRVSRERIRQICKACLRDIRNGFHASEIDSTLLSIIENAAEKKTEISMIDISDELLGRDGTVRAIVDAFSDRFELINSKDINGKWLVNKEDNVKNMIDYLSRTLQERDTPMKIEDVTTIFPINEEMLLSIKNVVEKDGYVTLSTNKMVVGRIPIIRNYLLSLGRPASIQEISNGTGLTLNQAKAAVSNKEFFESIGDSMYDSVDANYLECLPSELARNLLIAEGHAISIPKIVKYVLRYDCSGRSERDVLIELFTGDNSGVYDLDGYALLKEWGRDKIKKPARRNYTVELKNAVKNIVLKLDGVFNAEIVLNEIKQKYGDSTSNNMNSIRGYLNTLAKDGILVEIGKNTGCYRRPQE